MNLSNGPLGIHLSECSDIDMAFVTDPATLREVGTVDLPNLAEVLRQVAESLVSTESQWDPAFREDRTPNASMYDDSRRKWSSVCDHFYTLMYDSARRIDRFADALITVADNITTTDDITAEGFINIREEPA